MLEEVLRYLHNWFCIDIVRDDYTIEDGEIDLSFVEDNQYFRICGSVFNDGVYQAPATELTDEEFNGTIWVLAIPQKVLDLIEEIEAWQEENADAITSPYQSESFGGYSYSKASSGTSDSTGSSGITWMDVFGSRLARWRKI